jgi:hypothetical protein
LERRTLLSAAANGPLMSLRKSDFSDATDMTLNGSATNADTGGRLRLTDASDGQAGSAFFNDQVRLRFPDRSIYFAFVAEFDVKVTPGGGDPGEGFFFVVHNDPAGPSALGAGGGGGMGWAGLQNAFGVKFDFSNPLGSQTGVYAAGEAVSGDPADPRNRVIPDRFDLDSGKTLHVDLWYDIYEHQLNETIDDVGDFTTAPFTTSYDVDVPEAAGGETAYVGFTAATRDPAVAGPADGSARQEVLDFYYGMMHGDFFGARVTQVFVNGQGVTGQTSANGAAFRYLAGIDNAYGYPVPGGANQLKSIPWSNGVNKIALRFDNDVSGTLGQEDLAVRGVNNMAYPISGFAYDPATKTGVWTLASPVVNDKVRLFLDDALVSGLDGEWTTGQAYPSGDGFGGDFNFRINVLLGDANQDGVVNALDLGTIKQKLNKTATSPGSGRSGYSVFADLNADGLLNALDMAIAKFRLNNRLPADEPAALW